MSLSKNVNIDILNACFELSSFNGLKRPSENLEPAADKEKQESEADEQPDVGARASRYQIILLQIKEYN